MTNKHSNLTTRNSTILPKMMALVLAASLPVGCTALPGGPTGVQLTQQQAAGQQAQPTATAKTQTANDAQTASQSIVKWTIRT